VSTFAEADIIFNSEGFTRVEKVSYFKVSPASSVRIPAGQAQSFTSMHRPRPCCLQDFRNNHHRVAPVGREEMDVRSRRVIFTHAWGERRPRSVISSSGEMEVWVWTSGSVVVGLAAAVLTFAAAFYFNFPAVGLVYALDVGTDVLALAGYLLR
jgi:hypothetical protein